MKKYLALVVSMSLAAISTSFAAPDKDALMEKEKAAWQAYKDKKPDDFKKVVSANVVGLYSDGINNGIQGELDGMKSSEMKSFAISDYKTTEVGPHIMIATYVVKLEATTNGKDASGTLNCGTVWKEQKGNWQAIFHTNVKQQPAK